jgi:spore photoproduct lyase
LDCVYCILQAFLNSPVITFHVNVEKIIKETTRAIKNNPGQPFRVGTGEHSDSLALDHIFQVNSYLIEAFSKLSNATLELKTKTDNVDLLLGLRHGGRTVVAWSLNPGEVIKRNEFKTASLEGRLIAAERVIKEGYRVAFHFDPIIYYPDWENGYRETIRLLFERIPPESIAWISLGTLRYIPALKQLVEDRFPGDAIFSNEFIPTKDGKMKYLKPIRRRLVGTLAEWISKKAPTVPLYLCMEKRSIWERVMSVQPEDHVALERYLSSTTLPNR